jgi:hypothetical protein
MIYLVEFSGFADWVRNDARLVLSDLAGEGIS